MVEAVWKSFTFWKPSAQAHTLICWPCALRMRVGVTCGAEQQTDPMVCNKMKRKLSFWTFEPDMIWPGLYLEAYNISAHICWSQVATIIVELFQRQDSLPGHTSPNVSFQRWLSHQKQLRLMLTEAGKWNFYPACIWLEVYVDNICA